MDRELDGIYVRIKRGGRYENICLSDMTYEELNECLADKSDKWLRGAVIHLAIRLHEVGDLFGLNGGFEE